MDITLDLKTLPLVVFQSRALLPECSGVYFAMSLDHRPLYIGKAINLRNRWKSHDQSANLEGVCHYICWMEVHIGELDAIERAFITHYNPPYNTFGTSRHTFKRGKAITPEPEIPGNSPTFVPFPSDPNTPLTPEQLDSLFPPGPNRLELLKRITRVVEDE